jgi:hypothetical protein
MRASTVLFLLICAALAIGLAAAAQHNTLIPIH